MEKDDQLVFRALRESRGILGDERVEDVIMDEAVIVRERDGKEVENSAEYLSMAALETKLRQLRECGDPIPRAYEEARNALAVEAARKKRTL